MKLVKLYFLLTLFLGGAQAAAFPDGLTSLIPFFGSPREAVFPEKVDTSTLSAMTKPEAITWIQQNQANPALDGAKDTVRDAFRAFQFTYDDLRDADISPSLGIFAQMKWGKEPIFCFHSTFMDALYAALATDRVTYLSFSFDDVEPDDHPRLQKALSTTRNLVSLKILGEMNTDFISEVLAPFVSTTTTLQWLAISINDNDLVDFSKAIEINQSLTAFHTYETRTNLQAFFNEKTGKREIKIDKKSPGMLTLINTLKEKPKITSITLFNWMNAETLKSLGELLSLNRITSLSISNALGFKDIPTVLQKGLTLQHLSLTYVHYDAYRLNKHNTKWKYYGRYFRPIKEDTCKDFVSTLEKLTTLKSLTLKGLDHTSIQSRITYRIDHLTNLREYESGKHDPVIQEILNERQKNLL